MWVKWALGSITTKKASGGDGIPGELFQILKDDAVKVLPVCQEIWKTQQWPQDWKRSVFIPIPKKGNVKECSNYCPVAYNSHASKEILKILFFFFFEDFKFYFIFKLYIICHRYTCVPHPEPSSLLPPHSPEGWNGEMFTLELLFSLKNPLKSLGHSLAPHSTDELLGDALGK